MWNHVIFKAPSNTSADPWLDMGVQGLWQSQMCAEVGPGGLGCVLVCEAPLSNPTVCPLAGTPTSSQLLWQLLLGSVLMNPPLSHTKLPDDPSWCVGHLQGCSRVSHHTALDQGQQR